MNNEKCGSEFIFCPRRLCPNPRMGWTLLRELGNGLREYQCHCCAKLFYFNVRLWRMYRWHPKYSSLKYLVFENDSYDESAAAECDFILVRGGDGTMLKAVYRLIGLNKPFIGVKTGHTGFFLNSADEFSLARIRDEDYEIFEAPLLEAVIKHEDGSEVRELALNDVIIREDAGQSVRLEVKINGVLLDDGMFGDGLIVSTPLGSTAYTVNAGGVPLIPTLPALELTPVAPKPRNRIPIVVPEISVVMVRALELPKRKVRVNQGSIFKHEDVAEVEIKLSSQKVQLGFFKPRGVSWDDFFLNRFRERVYKA